MQAQGKARGAATFLRAPPLRPISAAVLLRLRARCQRSSLASAE
jgi:hypothetical protein